MYTLAPPFLTTSPAEIDGVFNAIPVFLKISELRSCVEVEVAVLGSPSLISLMVSVDVKQH